MGMPIDTLKTTLQTDGAKGIELLKTKLATGGFRTFYNGGLGAVMANIVGYYPWFATYNTLEEYLPKKDAQGNDFTGVQKLGRRALMGFGASAVSDVCSNSIRVLKVYKCGAASIAPTRLDFPETASKSEMRPPTSSEDGDESR